MTTPTGSKKRPNAGSAKTKKKVEELEKDAVDFAAKIKKFNIEKKKLQEKLQLIKEEEARIKFPVSEHILMEITKPKPVPVAIDAAASAAGSSSAASGGAAVATEPVKKKRGKKVMDAAGGIVYEPMRDIPAAPMRVADLVDDPSTTDLAMGLWDFANVFNLQLGLTKIGLTDFCELLRYTGRDR